MFRLFQTGSIRQPQRLQSTNFSRAASQLYPNTSHHYDKAMVEAETLVGDSSDFSNLKKWFSGEFTNITKYLQKLVGTNHPMLETAKRCTYLSEGRMGSAQARGLTVILTAKATESLARPADAELLTRNQVSLAEMTEMTYSAYMIHRGVIDLKLQESDDVEGLSKGVRYGNKVSILCGDFLLSYIMKGLGDLFSSKAVDLVASAITEFVKGEFMLIQDWRNKAYLTSEASREFHRWEKRSFASLGCLQGNTCQAALVLANIQGKLQDDAREFGKNLGLAWQAHTELQPFLNQVYEPVELPELPPYPAFDLNCLPVLLFLRNSHKTNKNFNLMLDSIKKTDMSRPSWINQHRHQEFVDYRRLHELILKDRKAVDDSYAIIRSYSQKAIKHLESFPQSGARDALSNICESLYKG